MFMTVNELHNVVLLFTNAVWSGAGTIPSTLIQNVTALSSDMAYSARYDSNITTLIDQYAVTNNGIIQGLLYVPDLPLGDPCQEIIGQYVPSTAVRQANLPPTDYNLIALAPWVTAECTQAFLAAARSDPLRALVVYQPTNTTDRPPDVTDETWNLDDGGLWQTENHFPIFAVPGMVGTEMMYQASLYSGNLSQVPFGKNITASFNPDPQDYVRIWTELAVTTNSDLPSIWVLVIAIIGLLIFIIVSISLLMHFVQRQGRVALRKRVISGDVNLEAMGIKRMTVPDWHVRSFPLFTYNYEPGSSKGVPEAPSTSAGLRRLSDAGEYQGLAGSAKSIAVGRPRPSSDGPGFRQPSSFSIVATDYQPICLICLEDYHNRETVIRELSCGHVFHPDCIDEFLTEISSLCPLCKVSMLPKGYCPKITNGMVRRERAVRKLRDRIIVDDYFEDKRSPGRISSWGSSVKQRVLSWRSRSPSLPTTNIPIQDLPSRPQLPASRPAPPPATEEGGVSNVTRQRMRDLAGSDIEEETSDHGNDPRWRKLRRQLFPGFN